jgi:acetyl esterase/lipase
MTATPLRIRLVRLLIATVELILRPLVLNRRLPPVREHRLGVPYGPHAAHRLDVAVPDKEGPVPIMLYIHGGGWITGDKKNFHWPTRAFAAHGMLVFSANYRRAPEASLSQQLRDVARALGWARDHAAELGGDPEQVYLAGDSAGAHLLACLHIGLTNRDFLRSLEVEAPTPASALRATLLFYGLYDLGSAWELGGITQLAIEALLGAKPDAAPEPAVRASPLFHVGAQSRPMLVCAGEPDPLYGQSLALLAALREHGVRHRPVLLSNAECPDAGHSFLNFGNRTATRRALAEAAEFIDEMQRSGAKDG